MPQSVRADLEERIGDQLRCALRMALHPFAAGKERCLHPLRAQVVDDASVITRHITVLFAEIEGERDQSHAAMQIDAADRAAQLGRNRRRRRDRGLPQRLDIERAAVALVLPLRIRPGKRLLGPALLRRGWLFRMQRARGGKRQQ